MQFEYSTFSTFSTVIRNLIKSPFEEPKNCLKILKNSLDFFEHLKISIFKKTNYSMLFIKHFDFFSVK